MVCSYNCRLFIGLFLTCILLVSLSGFGVAEDSDYKNIPVSRWPNESPIRPLTFSAWKAMQNKVMPFKSETVFRKNGQSGEKTSGNICIVVNRDLYYQIESAIDLYVDDLLLEGYSVDLVLSIGGEPQNLRQMLHDKYVQGMKGTILIGDLPIAWCEKTCDWGDWDEYEEWPCDLYYMDLDGIWRDIDGDGLIDIHEGNIQPEIWIGRLTPSPLIYGSQSEAMLIGNYFRKNHMYRHGNMQVANKSLLYTDDDWAQSDWLSYYMEQVHSNHTYVNDPYETTADNYREIIKEPFELIHLNAHSDANRHYFYVPSGPTNTASFCDIIAIDPPAAFYNLYACSNVRFTDNNYMGGWYIFKNKHGLAVVGSAKTGGMLLEQHFYSRLAAGDSFGEAFQHWFGETLSQFSWGDATCWFYGMTLCGDPTLRLKQSSCITVLGAEFSDSTYGDGDLIFEQGETITCGFTLCNNGAKPASDVIVTLTCNENDLLFDNNTISIGDIDTGQMIAIPASITFSIPSSYISRVDSFFLEIILNDSNVVDTIVYELSIGMPRILLVDDDNGGDIEKYYRMYFDNCAVPCDIIETTPPPTAVQLGEYPVVFWFTGDFRTNPLSNDEIEAMKGFLDNGGNLALSGQGIAAQLQQLDISFLNNYLKAQYLSTSYVPLLICDSGGPILGDVVDSIILQGNLGAMNQTAPDHVEPLNGGISEAKYFDTGESGAVSYSGDYRLFFCAFGLEALPTTDPRWLLRDTVMAHILDFFEYEYPYIAPSIVSLEITPGNPNLMLDHHPTFSWTYSDPNNLSQTRYQIRIVHSGYQNGIIVYDTGPLSGEITEYTYPNDDLEDGMTYEVEVRVSNGYIWSSWGEMLMHFNSVPNPEPVSPTNGETVVEHSPILIYDNPPDKEGGTVRYSLELYSDSLLSQLVESSYDIPAGNDTICQWQIGMVLESGGQYYWHVRAADEYEVGQWSETASFEIQPEYQCGDANNDETVNIGDAVYIINYAFKDGPVPDPYEAGDSNCDYDVNVGDAVYLINYVFKDGPIPCAECR